ncbi:hypothetical protein [Burkholderia cenocepacia]|uniref:hypothetical protein n=1 Tax=Burkholderia cenocepacia TaxID=95486 RepID=UPI0019031C0A|nr:hypothetical protein [Burkholderia cenocepacia]MBJ9696426.1 hypothetical protein [Burkholderia cenocepacia]
MSPPDFELSQPENVRRELLDDDRAVRDEFARELEPEINALAEALAACFGRIPPFREAAAHVGTRQSALVDGFLLGGLDDLVVSTKLLLAGKTPAAGNVMRQVIEGIAMAAMCVTDELLVIERDRKQGAIRARYWEKVWEDDRRVDGHRAVEQLGWNGDVLRFTAEAVDTLRRAKKHYNAFSHCGKVTIAARAALDVPGVFYVGGHFEAAKLAGYRAELLERTGLCRVLPVLIDHLIDDLQAAPKAVPAATGAANSSAQP